MHRRRPGPRFRRGRPFREVDLAAFGTRPSESRDWAHVPESGALRLNVGARQRDDGTRPSAAARGRAATRQRRDRARSAMATFGIEQYASVPAGSLPYGVRKLVELSRAFVREPRFMLLDEPVAGLSETETFLGVLVDGLDRLGCGVLLIEHDMPTVRELCERVYVLDTGAVIAEGPFAEVATDPRVVAAYLGADAV
ncbi:ATP-binding cassette domain-containing protein [Nocardioides aquaticus]|uniref:ABC transporter ATP-binding protein C-terminal domain-containing protein n=1 Tax=Nocardioides aquaticus TaxID=160826 RepID=UPI0023DFA78B|nr:ATP-binding cassette domain-containing protein [Nocardioides aquaticus]